MGYLLILIVGMFFTGLYLKLARSSWLIPDKVLHYLRWTHYTTIILTLLWLYLIFFQKTRFGCELLNKLLIWFPIGTAFILASLGKHQLSRKERRYFKIFQLIPIGLLLTMMVPFLGLTLAVHLFFPSEEIYYEDTQISVQTTFYGILAKPYAPDVYRKHGPFLTRITNRIDCPGLVEEVEVRKSGQEYHLRFFIDDEEAQWCEKVIRLD